MFPPAALIEQLTGKIIGCAIEVHKTLGAGLLESVYRECLSIEMRNAGLRFESEQHIRLTYKRVPIDSRLRLDLLVEGIVIIELKTVERVHPIHKAQVITYLTISNCPAGLLMNFNVTVMKAGIYRLYHPTLYTPKH